MLTEREEDWLLEEYKLLSAHYFHEDQVYFRMGGLLITLNGALIAFMKLPPFIVTLGSLTAVRGLARLVGNDSTVYNPDIPFAGTDPGRYELARQMSGAWSSFARTGKPDHASLPKWRPYTVADRATMVFDVKPTVVDDPGRLERMALLET